MNNDVKRGFKKKTIHETIFFKMHDWIKTITDKELALSMQRDLIVTGGSITSMLLGELPNDYDVYFRNPQTAKAVADYYLSAYIKNDMVSKIESTIVNNDSVVIRIKSAGIIQEGQEGEGGLNDYQYFESMSPVESARYFKYKRKSDIEKKYRVSYISSNAISLTDDVQIILRFTGSPEEIHKNYDFVHATNYFTMDEGLTLHPEAMEATLAKELRYVGSRYPICSMFRLKKFIRRGWTITAGQMFKIAWDISKLDLDNREVLYDQLVGVDAAYFHEILGALKDKDSEAIDRTYLFELVNRVFDSPDTEIDDPLEKDENNA